MEERRKTERMEIELQASARTLPGEEEVSIRSLNVSQGGACFSADNPPGRGDMVLISTGNTLEAVGEVVRVLKHSDKQSVFAVRFLGSDDGGLSPVDPSPNASIEGLDSPEAPSTFYAWSFELKRVNEAAFVYYQSLGRVHAYVTENYWQDLPLEAVARIAAMEKTYFSAFFHKKVGISFSSWLQHIRISKALTIMKTRDYSVTEIATRVGFDNMSTFRRTFKKWTNLTPTVVRRMIRPC